MTMTATQTKKPSPGKNKPEQETEKPVTENSTLSLFPHILVRVAGEPFEDLEKLKAPKSWRKSEQVEAMRDEFAQQRQRLSDLLYEQVAQTVDGTAKQFLLKIRRDLFNERPVGKIDQERLLSMAHQNVVTSLKTYFNTQNDFAKLFRDGEVIFEHEMVECRRHLQVLAQTETLSKGLVISSQSLLKRVSGYLSQNVEELNKKDYKTERSLLKYITRIYAKTSPFSTFTNLAMGKLGTNTDETTEAKGLLHLADDETPEVISHIRLNNFLYQYLKGLLTKNSNIYRYFLLRPNPTLRNNGDNYLFLTNSNNVESFQRIPVNPVLEVFRILPSEKKEGIIYQELIETIIENEYIDAPVEDITSYIDQLIEYGFLEFNIGVSGIDPDWDIKFREKLEWLSGKLPLINELIETLAHVRELANQYGKAVLSVRKQILEDAYDSVRGVCMKLHEAAGLPEDERKTPDELQEEAKTKREAIKKKQGIEKDKQGDSGDETVKESEETNNEEDKEFKHQTATYFYFKPEQMFFEDTSLTVEPYLNEQHLMKLVSTLHKALQGMKMFEGRLEEKDRMLHFFRKKYGNDTDSIDLLALYEDYYRDVKKPEEEREAEKRKAQWEGQQKKKTGAKQADGRQSKSKKSKKKASKQLDEEVFPVPSIKMRREQRQKWFKRFQATVKNQMNGADNLRQVNLLYDQIRKVNSKESENGIAKGKSNSYGMFIQLYEQKGAVGQEKLMGVLNSSLPGFGKMISRFLHIYKEATNDTRTWNQALAGDKLFLEDCDASYFNANLHPPLMPNEIWTPGGHNSLNPQQQIPVTDLQVLIERENNELKLIHKPSSQQVNVFDQGFQGHMGRSPLYRLLETFTAVEYLSCHPLITGVNTYLNSQDEAEKKNQKADKINFSPRIVYEEQIVLRRKTWFVPRSLLPFKKPEESDWTYFSRVNQWRIEQNMPDEIFLFINPVRDNQQVGNKNPEAYKKIGRDDYKPQYICFKMPLLVNLLEKLLQRVPEFLRIEEMLPNSQQLLAFGENHRVTEFVVQWYTNVTESKIRK